MAGSAAAFAGDLNGLNAVGEWLSGLTAAELLRVDGLARQWPWAEPALGQAAQWTAEVMDLPSLVVPSLASMHAEGFVRERAVTRLAGEDGWLADRALAVRLTDHVRVIGDRAAQAVFERVTLDSAARIMPLLQLMGDRKRVGDARVRYLGLLSDEHGDAVVWARLRESSDRNLRRVAFRRSLAHGLVDVEQAAAALPTETDQVVRSLLSRVIGEKAAPEVIADVLLKHGTPGGRALGLVRLRATQIDPDVLQRLLIDSSVLVRLWARTRWRELGRDANATYRAMTRDPDLAPRLRARAYGGLLEAEGAIDHAEALDLLHSGLPPLVKVGLKQLADDARAEDVAALFDVVRTGTAKEARLASTVLLGLRRAWTVEDLASMKVAEDARLRRRAWWLHRGLGGWEETLADLVVVGDADVDLSTLGRGVRPPMYLQPNDEQRQRLRALLAVMNLPRDRLLDIAFAAGIQDALPKRMPQPDPVAADLPATQPTGWRRWLRSRTGRQ